MAIITISRQFGSGGDEIASGLCEALHYQPFDKRIIAQAAASAGLGGPAALETGAVEDPRVSTFLDRLFDISTAFSGSAAWQDDMPGLYSPEPDHEETSLDLVRRSVEHACQVGNMVIMGRGGQVILCDCPGVLHVRIEAPLKERVQRVKGYLKRTRRMFNSDSELQRDAHDWVLERDAASAQFVRRHFQADWADPLWYHVVINTGKLEMKSAVRLLVRLAEELT
jgi:CMP/dCMP kinase